MAVAGSAPAYSLAATTAILVGTVGLAGSAALLYCVIPMLGIALAFGYLGRNRRERGAGYSWVGRTLRPFLGFISGWALVDSATMLMVAGALPAGAMLLSLFAPSLADHTAVTTGVGAGWFLITLLVMLGGAWLTVRAQLLMSGVERTILAVFAVGTLLTATTPSPATGPGSASATLNGMHGFASGVVIAAFYCWGWDVTSNLRWRLATAAVPRASRA